MLLSRIYLPTKTSAEEVTCKGRIMGEAIGGISGKVHRILRRGPISKTVSSGAKEELGGHSGKELGVGQEAVLGTSHRLAGA